MATPEGKVKAAVKKVLFRRGLLQQGTDESKWPNDPCGSYYMPVQNGMGIHGIHDFQCVANGMYFTIETKGTTKDELTPNQESRKREIELSGGMVYVVKGLDEVEALYDALIWIEYQGD